MLDYKLDLSDHSYMRVLTLDSSVNVFPFCLYETGYFEAGREYFTVRDSKPMYLLIYTISGGGTVRTADRMRHLGAGDAVLLDCRRFHEYRTVSSTPWCFHWIHFDGSSMAGYASALSDELAVVEVGEKLRMNRYFEELHALVPEANSYSKGARITDLIAGILLLLINSRFGSGSDIEPGRDAVSTACHYIEENLSQEITIDDLTEVVHLSKFYFIRLFKRYMGVSPYRYVQITRINRAKELLITTDYRVNEIADMTGFSNATRFTKLFSEMTGTTPTKYRKSSFQFSGNPKEQ